METSVNHPTPELPKIIKGKIWLVLVGINNYENLSDLNFCADDCRDLAKTFELVTQNFEDREIIALHDFQSNEEFIPKKENILSSIAKFSSAQPEDTILFYFSGHGEIDPNEERPVLCLTDTQEDDFAGTGLTLDTLLEALATSQAQHKLVFLDACRSGSITNRVIDRVQQQTDRDSNLYAIVSCKKKQSSWEIPSLKHGAFTYCLIEGLRGRAADSKGLITASNLFSFIGEQIQKYLKYAKEGQSLSEEKGLKVNNLENKGQTSRQKQGQIPDYAFQEPECITRISKTPTLGYATKIPRQALVINSLYTSKTTLRLVNLFQGKGGFEVNYYPSKFLDSSTIDSQIISCFTSDSAETALLYLAGRIEEIESNIYKLWLSEEISLTFNSLRKYLDNSTIKEKVVILDLWGTVEVKAFPKARQLGFSEKQSLIVSYAQEANSRIFLPKLVEILELAAQSEKELWLMELITQLQNWKKQQPNIAFSPLVPDYTDTINILLPQNERNNNPSFVLKQSPYKGLKSFTKDDAYFFHGREELTEEIYNKLRTTNFLAVVGASGSGKSSVVQAGVLPLVEQKGLYQSEELKKCQTWIMRPDQKPFESLARVLGMENELTEGQFYLAIDSFVCLLAQQPFEISILVIDQFEELFTLTKENERQEFLDLLLKAIYQTANRFKVIITLRYDFLENCSELPALNIKVNKNTVQVPPYITEDQCRSMITIPAQKAGILVEPELENELVEQVSGEIGLLPLMGFTLEQLWEKQVNGKLELIVFQTKIGGLKTILERQADNTYKQLTQLQKECAEWIFIRLVRLGSDRKHTKQRLLVSDLITNKFNFDLVQYTLSIFINNRLIISNVKARETNTNEKQITAEATVEIIHEILIRTWSRLEKWLKINQEVKQFEDKIKSSAEDWLNHDKNTDYLTLKGVALGQAKEFKSKYEDIFIPTNLEFIQACIDERTREEEEEKSRQRQLILNFVDLCLASAEMSVKSQKTMEGLISALKAVKEIRYLDKIDTKIRIKIITTLLKIFDNFSYHNCLYFTSPPTKLMFSPDGKMLASSHEDGTIRIWNLKGKILKVLDHNRGNYTNSINNFVFSPNGDTIASVDDSNLFLWNLPTEKYRVHEIRCDHSVPIVFSSNEKQLICGNLNEVYLLDIDAENILSSFSTKELNKNTGNIISSYLSKNSDKNHTIRGIINNDNNFLIVCEAKADKTNIFSIEIYDIQGNIVDSVNDIKSSMSDKYLSSINGDIFGYLSLRNKAKVWKRKQKKGLFNSEQLLWSTGKIIDCDSNALCMAISPDGEIVILGKENAFDTFHLHNLRLNQQTIFSKERTKFGSAPYIAEDIVFSNDSKKFVTILQKYVQNNFAVKQATIDLWNIKGELINTLTIDRRPHHQRAIGTELAYLYAFSPNLDTFASCNLYSPNFYKDENFLGDTEIKLSSFSKQKLLTKIKLCSKRAEKIVFSNDGNLIASLHLTDIAPNSKQINQERIDIWNYQGDLIDTLNITYQQNSFSIHEKELWINNLKFSPNGSKLGFVDSEGIHVWSMKDKKINSYPINLNYINQQLRSSFSFYKDFKLFDFCPNQEIIALLNQQSIELRNFDNKLIHTFKISPNPGSPDFFTSFSGISFDKNGNLGSIDKAGNFILRKLDGEILNEIKFSLVDLESTTLAFLPFVSKIFIPPSNLTYEAKNLSAKLQNLNDLTLQKLDGILSGQYRNIKVNPKHPHIFASWAEKENEPIKVWNIEKQSHCILENCFSYEPYFAFSPDGELIAYGNKNGTISLWNLEGEFLGSLSGHTGEISSIAFSPCGNILATSGEDEKIILWNLDLDELFIKGCNWAKDYLTYHPKVNSEDRKLFEELNEASTIYRTR